MPNGAHSTGPVDVCMQAGAAWARAGYHERQAAFPGAQTALLSSNESRVVALLS